MKIEHVAIWVNDLEGMRDFINSTLMVKKIAYIIIRKSNLNLIL